MGRCQVEESWQHAQEGLGRRHTRWYSEVCSQVRRLGGCDRFNEDEHMSSKESEAIDLVCTEETVPILVDRRAGLADGVGLDDVLFPIGGQGVLELQRRYRDAFGRGSWASDD